MIIDINKKLSKFFLFFNFTSRHYNDIRLIYPNSSEYLNILNRRLQDRIEIYGIVILDLILYLFLFIKKKKNLESLKIGPHLPPKSMCQNKKNPCPS